MGNYFLFAKLTPAFHIYLVNPIMMIFTLLVATARKAGPRPGRDRDRDRVGPGVPGRGEYFNDRILAVGS